MLVNYFCGVADKLKSLARQAQVTDPADSSHWLGRLKALARQTQSADPADSNHKLLRASRQPFCTHLLVLQVPNILRLVVDRDRLNLGIV